MPCRVQLAELVAGGFARFRGLGARPAVAEGRKGWPAGVGSRVLWLVTDPLFRGLNRGAVCLSVIEFMDKELSGKRSAATKE